MEPGVKRTSQKKKRQKTMRGGSREGSKQAGCSRDGASDETGHELAQMLLTQDGADGNNPPQWAHVAAWWCTWGMSTCAEPTTCPSPVLLKLATLPRCLSHTRPVRLLRVPISSCVSPYHYAMYIPLPVRVSLALANIGPS